MVIAQGAYKWDFDTEYSVDQCRFPNASIATDKNTYVFEVVDLQSPRITPESWVD